VIISSKVRIAKMTSIDKLLFNFSLARLTAVGVGIIFLLCQTMTLAVFAQLSAKETIDKIFRSDTPFPGATAQEHENLMKVKAGVIQWLGSYRGVRQEKGRSVILFERGSVPAIVEFEKNGEPKSIDINECPVTPVPISQAPKEFRETLSECPNLKP
jgi:hypothetical protein